MINFELSDMQNGNGDEVRMMRDKVSEFLIYKIFFVKV